VSRAAKRALDLVLSSLLLVVLSPILGTIALAVLVTSGRPVLFRQARPGLNAKPFVLLKFRSMAERLDSSGELLPDGERITSLGRFLRRFSLDELPELWNVLKGEMSLVGTRPLLLAYLDRYTPQQARRHEVKPGITGWAQVNGRNALSWEEKFALDLWYVDHWSLWLDWLILFRTFWQVVTKSGISFEGHATMPEFTGALKEK
jgi:sugar transferase EpsL